MYRERLRLFSVAMRTEGIQYHTHSRSNVSDHQVDTIIVEFCDGCMQPSPSTYAPNDQDQIAKEVE
jgi:hypothetical protein